MALFSAIIYSVEDQIIYAIANDFHPTMFFVYNSNVSVILCVIVTLAIRPKKPTSLKELLLIIFYGTLCTIVHITLQISIFAIGPGNADALFFTSTVFTVILSIVFLKTKPKAIEIVFIICSTTGVVFVTRYVTLFEITTEGNSISLGIIGVAFALAAAITFAATLVLAKKLSQLATPALIAVFSYLFQYAVAGLILCTFYHAWKLPETLISATFVASTGATLFFGMLFEYLAVRYANPTTVSIILTLQVVLSFVGQFTLFSFPLNWTVLVGSVLIIFSCIGLLLLKKEGDGTEINDGEINDEEAEPILDNFEILN
ncbi:Solute carrier family 35 member G1 [Holothuria leucospilota]|uniref:Solute carrier family 35 member G1 n=1 Tax=Holothuria leucospilota TaxID=206669 RepID=A0A9Q0YJ67_HOLLE|nr:Solute carrier family 35 member G1 [Holothuria leucospilota]